MLSSYGGSRNSGRGRQQGEAEEIELTRMMNEDAGTQIKEPGTGLPGKKE